ncbi:hypothetical protein LCGC14_2357340 [marine sediment metagenome]|uniref:UDP-glucose/GDP-mannose dehydrogenase C-terminal domain-containing protein n=1 Tax=marine sediment metagenome TaxID=412755 RepID=A0A0F9F2K6_9ZZZZ
MAEEEEKPEITDSAVATAEPPKPPIPEDESVPEPKEDAAAAEGEAPPAEETPDEDVPLADLIVQAQAVNPELVDDLISKLPEEDQAKYRSSDTERAALEAEQSQLTRTTQLNTAFQAYQPYSQPVNTAEWTGWAEGVVRDARDKVREAIRDGKEDADVLPAEFSQLVTGLANYGNNLRSTQQDYLSNVYQNGLMATLTAHPSYQLLPKEVRAETDVVKLLQLKGGEILFSDPFVQELKMSGKILTSQQLTPDLVRSTHCLVVTTDHTVFDYRMVLENATMIVDTRNAFGSRGLKSDKIIDL